MDDTGAPRTVALLGPGRAGTAVCLALAGRGWAVTGVAGRGPGRASTRRAAALLDAPAVEVAAVGRGARLVVVATPDSAIAAAGDAVAASVEPGALVIHLAGARALDVLDGLVRARPDVEVGSLHPLQTLPAPAHGPARLPGCWCAIDGPATVERLALTLGMRPLRVDPARRAAYHAAACVASNHLVALLGQVERLAGWAGVPLDALLPLARATIDNVAELGPAAALTGPVARGDAETVARHLAAIPDDERGGYRALALEALRLTRRVPADLEHALA